MPELPLTVLAPDLAELPLTVLAPDLLELAFTVLAPDLAELAFAVLAPDDCLELLEPDFPLPRPISIDTLPLAV